MAVLEVVINSKLYQLGCADDEKEFITGLVAEINKRIKKSKKQAPEFFENIADDQMFLYQLLLVYSELKELKQKKKDKEAKDQQKLEMYKSKEIENLNATIENLKLKVQQLSKLIESK